MIYMSECEIMKRKYMVLNKVREFLINLSIEIYDSTPIQYRKEIMDFIDEWITKIDRDRSKLFEIISEKCG